MSSTVIELDLSAEWEPEEPAGRRLSGRWLVPVWLLAVLLSPGADPTGGLDPVVAVDAASSYVTTQGRTLYVVHPPAGAAASVEAIDTRTGRQRWHVRTETAAEYLVHGSDDVVVLAESRADGAEDRSRLRALDGRTGEQRWEREQLLFTAAAGPVLVTMDSSDLRNVEQEAGNEIVNPLLNAPGQQIPHRLIGVSAATGETVWERTVPRGAGYAVDDVAQRQEGRRRLMVLEPSGALHVFDPRDGRVVAEHRLDWSGEVSYFHVVDDRVFVHRAGEVGSTVHDLTTGRLVVRRAPTQRGGDWIMSCGPVLCQADATGVWGIDPDTGRLAWRVGRWNTLVGVQGSRLVFGPPVRNDTGTLSDPSILVVDARTGRPERLVERWAPVTVLPDGRLIAHQRDRAVTVLAALDLERGVVTVFGRSLAWAGEIGCVASAAFVTCSDQVNVAVWPIPRAQ